MWLAWFAGSKTRDFMTTPNRPGEQEMTPPARADHSLPAPILEGDELARKLLLTSATQAERYAKITSGDPLRVFERSALQLKRRNYLIETERLANHATGLASMVHFDVRDDLQNWLNARIDEAIEDLLFQDVVRMEAKAPYIQEDYDFLLHFLGIHPDRALKAAIAFNGLSDLARRTFFDLLVFHRSIAECLEDGLGPLDLLRYRAQLAVYSLLGTKPKRVDLSVDLEARK